MSRVLEITAALLLVACSDGGEQGDEPAKAGSVRFSHSRTVLSLRYYSASPGNADAAATGARRIVRPPRTYTWRVEAIGHAPMRA